MKKMFLLLILLPVSIAAFSQDTDDLKSKYNFLGYEEFDRAQYQVYIKKIEDTELYLIRVEDSRGVPVFQVTAGKKLSQDEEGYLFGMKNYDVVLIKKEDKYIIIRLIKRTKRSVSETIRF